ncbi:MAG: serine/threonine-protein kinase [Gemmataceae bacterium]
MPGTDLVLEELLGVGGFGEVWKASHQTRPHAAPVALKFCVDEAAARTLRKEVELLDRVSREGRHHGIVELRYAHLETDPPCLEYEYVDGGDLAGLIVDLRRAGKADPITMTRLFYSLTQAVGVAHRIRPPVVHRDLKPANVLTTRIQNHVVLKVLDFGIGAVGAQKRSAGETLRGGPVTESAGACTPLYASPQQRRGDAADPRDDVYALGVIWYQMLLGDVTKEAPRGGSWKKRLLDLGATSRMLALLERCLEDDPADRPVDAAILTEELMNLITASVGARPAPPPLPARPVVAGVAVVPRQFTYGMMWFKIILDGQVLGESRLLQGAEFPFETTAGAHTLEIQFGGALMATKCKSYALSFHAAGTYRVTFQPKMGFLAMNPTFADELQVARLAA